MTDLNEEAKQLLTDFANAYRRMRSYSDRFPEDKAPLYALHGNTLYELLDDVDTVDGGGKPITVDHLRRCMVLIDKDRSVQQLARKDVAEYLMIMARASKHSREDCETLNKASEILERP